MSHLHYEVIPSKILFVDPFGQHDDSMVSTLRGVDGTDLCLSHIAIAVHRIPMYTLYTISLQYLQVQHPKNISGQVQDRKKKHIYRRVGLGPPKSSGQEKSSRSPWDSPNLVAPDVPTLACHHPRCPECQDPLETGRARQAESNELLGWAMLR